MRVTLASLVLVVISELSSGYHNCRWPSWGSSLDNKCYIISYITMVSEEVEGYCRYYAKMEPLYVDSEREMSNVMKYLDDAYDYGPHHEVARFWYTGKGQHHINITMKGFGKCRAYSKDELGPDTEFAWNSELCSEMGYAVCLQQHPR